MTDQNHIEDWDAYFKALGPRDPFTGPPITPMFVGTAMSVVFVRGIDLERVVQFDEDSFLDGAKEVWEANGMPEMWLFISSGGPPWHVDAAPKTVNKKGRKS
jgi:hypothetical protein